jgi:hypothetical protein
VYAIPDAITTWIQTKRSSFPVSKGGLLSALLPIAIKMVSQKRIKKGAKGKCPPPNGVACRYTLLNGVTKQTAEAKIKPSMTERHRMWSFILFT